MKDGGEVWVYCDLRSERLFGLSLKTLAKSRGLAGELGVKCVALLAGSSQGMPGGCEGLAMSRLDLEDAAQKLIGHGADEVYVMDDPALATPRTDVYAGMMSSLIKFYKPRLVIFALTDFGREVAAMAAWTLQVGLISHCVDLRVDEGGIVASCPAWGGEVMAEIYFAKGQKTGLATLAPHAFTAVEAAGDPGLVRMIDSIDIACSGGAELVSCAPLSRREGSIEDAEVIVCGGAGLGGVEGFSLVHDLARAIGGEVGATRPPVLQHWVEESRLIGQTGKTVRPRLLVSVGTSGAVQYTAGIAESGYVVAINRDPEAPIFEVADLGVVAEAKSFLPMVTDRARKALMRKLADLLGEGRGPAEEGDKSFGAKVRAMREAHGMSVIDMSKATGKSPEFIGQVESGEVTPSVSFLLSLARALGVDPSAFLTDEEKTKLKDARSQAFQTRTQNYSYQTLTPGASNEHLRAFMITIEPKSAHKPVAYKHEGEEFIFILEGELELRLGEKVHHLKPGENIHFDSEIPHKLKSLSDDPTKCLVILYTP